MNDLGIDVEGRDLDSFAFDSSFGKKLRANTVSETDLEDPDDNSVVPLSYTEETDSETEQDQCDLEVLQSLQQADLKDFTGRYSNEATSSNFAFVEIADLNGNMRLVQKTIVCLFLEEKAKRMSSDRVLKFRQLSSFATAQKLIVKKVEEKSTLRKGDWCLFKTQGDKRYSFLLGRILQFQSLSYSRTKPIYECQLRAKDLTKGKKIEKRKKTGSQNETEIEDDIGVNCTWYQFDGQTPKSKNI